MSDKVIENNQVSVIGEIVSEFTFSHEVFGEGFYMMDVLVRRLSDSADGPSSVGVFLLLHNLVSMCCSLSF